MNILEASLHFTVSEVTDQFLTKSARIRNFTHFFILVFPNVVLSGL